MYRMVSACVCPTRPAWRGVSQAKINFSKARAGFVAMQQDALWCAARLAGLGFAGNWRLSGGKRAASAAAI
jgi:hypothetical protein